MAWNDASELLIGTTGEVSVAPVGTALPTNPTSALNAAFVGLGYTDEDGVSLSSDPQISEYNAWQSPVPVRRERTSQQGSVTFKLEQFNEETVPFAFGGGEVTSPSTGVYKYTLPAGNEALDERAMVVDVQDGDNHWRFVFPRGNVTESVSTDLRRAALGLLPVTFKLLAPLADPNGPPGYWLTDSDAFAAGS